MCRSSWKVKYACSSDLLLVLVCLKKNAPLGQRIYAHKAMLVGRCKVLAAMFSGLFVEDSLAVRATFLYYLLSASVILTN